MGERKVLNKYYPNDFDPSQVPRRRRPANGQIKIRTMLPMTLRCAACGGYLGRGTKFNARKEDVAGERYLGAIQLYRFYIRCPRCAAEIAFRTDPGSSGHAVESGATPCREGGPDGVQDATAGKRGREGEETGGGDPMAALEGRAREGKREMDADAALEEARSLNARRAGVAPEQLLQSLMSRGRTAGHRKTREELEQADEELIKSVRFHSSTGHVKRIEDEEEDFFEACLAKAVANRQAQKQGQATSQLANLTKRRRMLVAAADAKAQGDLTEMPEGSAPAGEAKASSGALQVLCCSYGDGSDDDQS